MRARWSLSEKNQIKLNFDGSKDGQGRAGVSYAIRDDRGVLLAAGSLNCGHDPVMVAEARGLREGVRVSTKFGTQQFRH